MNEDQPLYQQIADWIRQQIMSGRFGPGDRLPSVRQMTKTWGCTPGTVQRAYGVLAEQGLVTSRPGQGTHVVAAPAQPDHTSLRRATLLHRAEAFLLESLTAGYQPEEIENSVHLALDRWRIVQKEPPPVQAGALRFAGSHDPALAWLAAHFDEIAPGYHLQLGFSGSLGGLIALAEGVADLAGSHLWDKETDAYNEPYVRRLLPGKRVALVTFAHRRLGLILAAGNPSNIHSLADLVQPGLVFVNRQPGSGTRVWLDAALHRSGIDTSQINGYANEKMTHTEVAEAIAAGKANAGFGLETTALTFGLSFIPLVRERYDLVTLEENLALPPLHRLVDWLMKEDTHQVIQSMGGYETEETGKLRWVEE